MRTEFVSKSRIPYENGGPVTLCVNGTMIIAIDGIKLLLEVEAIDIIVVWTYEGELGGGMPPTVAVVEGV